MNLFTHLSLFKGSSDENELYKMFKELATVFLYGGYIDVHHEYQIYIRTVEFYFHSEIPDGIHDPIVYHRNGKGLENMPYFPLMTLHAHNSGFDITFENEEKQYRASALIRSYEIKDKDGNYLKWDKDKQQFITDTNYQYITQSTYLYTLLNGFSLRENNPIKWIDTPISPVSSTLSGKPRKNVFKYDEKGEKTEERCKRNWSFTRNRQI